MNIFEAVENGDLSQVKELIRDGVDVNTKNIWNKTREPRSIHITV